MQSTPKITSLISRLFNTLCFFALSSITIASAEEKNNSAIYTESMIKAALIYNIIHFIDWPTEDLTLCVYRPNKEDKSSFNSLPKMTKSGQHLEVKFLPPNGKLLVKNNCQLTFVTAHAESEAPTILSALQGVQSLTIGESSKFIGQGGMINFIQKDSTIKFEININALKKSNLDLSSQVLRLADRVYTE